MEIYHTGSKILNNYLNKILCNSTLRAEQLFINTCLISGTDSGKFDWMKVRTREGDLMQCKFYEQLDNQSEEIGRECTIL